MESTREPILQVEHLKKYFDSGTHVLARSKDHIKAVDDVSFQVQRGSTFALVGESGCGKSTIARLLLRLITATDGNAIFEGKDLFTLPNSEMRAMRRHIQMIFQDPYSSLNPRWQINKIIAEPLETHGIGTRAEQKGAVEHMLRTVGLAKDSGTRYAHEFSGGQRQRIGIARALALNPDFIVADEAVSALDVSVQAQVINLLQEMKEKYHLTYLFISHDLAVILNVCDRVGVMYLGRIVEMADKKTLFSQPLHPYTQALLSAAPQIGKRGVEQVLSGEVPSPISPPKGCAFHPRCPHAKECCKEHPPMVSLPDGRQIACWMYA